MRSSERRRRFARHRRTLCSRADLAAEPTVSDDQFFQFVSLLAVALFIASGALPMSPRLRRLARIGAAAVLAAGLVAAFALFVAG
jgi:hypothetical protein